ncbi:WD domain [Trypanosoma vivax]|uniref:Uncharacterized protein n=1 Tax=Trypanosoma vivax (strain Y486) TaxID=1055687 RepID=G0UA23_TRYVY|nr:hypothetical protein TRVL_06221 [Trypanosoma vivax]KAH8618982.1 WD domain [Trypanosoma vivax]CCC52654.1 conserved hypothetical protein [Trypanosoma vivax Y486]
MLTSCNVRVVSTPFAINGLECYEGTWSVNTPHVVTKSTKSDTKNLAGNRGIRDLSRKKQTDKAEESHILLASMHRRGKLIVWDADTMDVVGVCEHHGSSVVQCVVTPTYIYVRLESDGDFEDKEASVFVWHTKTLKLYQRIVAHDSRVTSIAVSDTNDSCFATACVEQTVHIWDLEKSYSTPMRKISVSSNPFVSLYFHGVVFASFQGCPFVLWDAETGEEVFRVKEGAAGVSLVRWLHDPKRVTNRSKVQKSPSLLVGLNDGFIRIWEMNMSDKMALTYKWGHKVHQSHMCDLCGDDEVVLSCSPIDGAFLSLTSSTKVTLLFSYGVRVGVLETSSKNAVLGAEDGTIVVLNYAEFASGTGIPFEVATFRPHTSGVTGIFIQLHDNQNLDRLICSGADGSLIFLDYSKSRGGRWLRNVPYQALDNIRSANSLILPSENGQMELVNSQSLTATSKEPLLSGPVTVSVVRWIESRKKLLLGCGEGLLAIYMCRFNEGSKPSFHKVEERRLVPYVPLRVNISESGGDLGVVCLRKAPAQCEGAFLVINVENADLMFPMQTIPGIFPIRASLVPVPRSEEFDYTVILQLRDGAMIQYAGNSMKKSPAVVLRNLVQPYLMEVLAMERSGLAILPPPYVLCLHSTGRDIPVIKIIYAERSRLRQITFNATTREVANATEFTKREPSAGQSEEHQLEVVNLHDIGQNEMGLAVVRDSPYVDIVSYTGIYMHRIWYGGDVLNYQVAGRRRRRSISFPLDQHSLSNSKVLAPHSSCAACNVAFCPEARYLAIGYRDGLVQLFDTTQCVIFARFSMHNSMVASLYAFQNVVVSLTVDGCCFGGVVSNRVMFGDELDSFCSLPSVKTLMRPFDQGVR